MNASRDMNPRWGCGSGEGAGLMPAFEREGDVDGDGCDCGWARGGAGGDTVLEPDVSSAMILRIEARISSMLGSTLGSNLDILVPSRDGDARTQGPWEIAGGHSHLTPSPTGQSDPIENMVAGRATPGNDPNTSYPRSTALSRQRNLRVALNRLKTKQNQQ
jgi:hypothetical protein